MGGYYLLPVSANRRLGRECDCITQANVQLFCNGKKISGALEFSLSLLFAINITQRSTSET